MDIIDFFYQYLLHFVILIASFEIFYLFYYHKSSSKNFPPGKMGFPFVGETLAYALAARRGTLDEFFTDRIGKYSHDVFRTSLFGEDMAVFCGASGNKFLFSGENKYVTSWWPRSIKKVLMHPSTVKNSFLVETTKLRSLLSQFLKPESLQRYIPVMDSMAKEHLKKEWSPYNDVKVFPLSKKYTFALACRLFISVTDPDHVAKFAEPFTLVTAGLISVPINLPCTNFNRAVKAGKKIRKELSTIILKRKVELQENNDTATKDLLSVMLLDGMTEIEISSKIVGFFIASHDTTSSVITFIASYLADHPSVYSKVFAEQMEILKSKESGQLLNWDDIKKMKYSWCVVCEVMRLSPPSNGAFREATTDFTYAGYAIPKGWKTLWSVHTTHKNPKYFPDSDKFDPSRFEGIGPAPHTFVPFGGGPRMCPGKEFARLEILVFMHNLVTKFKWKKLRPNEKIKYILSPIPMEGLPASLETIET